jgi:putative membrane protein insertion efficiency factor
MSSFLGVYTGRSQCAGHKRRKWGWRAAVCCGTLLLASLLCAQTALADEKLLRGPRRAVPAPATSAEPSAAGGGILERIASAPVRFYQRFLGPLWGRRCSYYPSCSNYALLAIRKHGALVGSIMTFDRLQHESNEARYSPLIQTGGEIRVYDPLENNDYWWYTAVCSQPAAPACVESEAKP